MFAKYLHNGVLLLYQLHCSKNSKKNYQLLDYKQNVEAEPVHLKYVVLEKRNYLSTNRNILKEKLAIATFLFCPNYLLQMYLTSYLILCK